LEITGFGSAEIIGFSGLERNLSKLVFQDLLYLLLHTPLTGL